MIETNLNLIDSIFNAIKQTKSVDEEILTKLFSNVANFANLTNGSSFDKTLFNERNSKNQKKIITSCLVRLLCSNEGLIWEDITFRLKTFKFLDEQMVLEYKILGIKPDDDNHIKLSKLRDIEENMYKDFDVITDSMNNLNKISDFRKNFMKAIRNPLNKIIIEVFGSSLLNDQRINDIFESASIYLNSAVNEQFMLYQNFCTTILNYLGDANKNTSIVAKRCIIQPINKLYKIIESDFNCKDVIKTTDLDIEDIDRKYQFSINESIVYLKFLLKNLGPGYAFDVQVEIQDVDGYLYIDQPIKKYGELGPSNLQVVFEANVERCTKEKVGVFLYISWENFDKKRMRKEYVFELKSQKNDIDWDYLKLLHPYSLEAVDTEEELVGRNEVISNLYAKLTALKIESSIIYGQKRVGKTSIAQTIHNKIKKLNNFTSVFIKMGDIDKTSSPKLINYLGNEIINELSYFNEFEGLTKPDFESALAPLIRYFKNIKHLYPEKKFVIILDEFDEIPSEFYHSTNIGDTFFHNIRSLSSEGYIGFVLVGGENMQIIKQSTDRLNKFYTFRVDYFDKSKRWKDFQDLIRRPVKDSIEFSDASILKLYEMTEGNPFFTKLICQNIYNSMCEKRSSYVTEDEVETAIIETVDSMDINHINHFWKDGLAEDDNAQRDNIETQRRKFLVAFADIKKTTGQMVVSKKELQENDLLKNSVAVNEMINSFLNREILSEENGAFRIKPKFIEKWLIERGSKLISTSFLNENAINELNKKENELYVKDKEILELSSSWGLYRGNKITPPELRSWLDQFRNNKEKRLIFHLYKLN